MVQALSLHSGGGNIILSSLIPEDLGVMFSYEL
jgi:hypothetical protein